MTVLRVIGFVGIVGVLVVVCVLWAGCSVFARVLPEGGNNDIYLHG